MPFNQTYTDLPPHLPNRTAYSYTLLFWLLICFKDNACQIWMKLHSCKLHKLKPQQSFLLKGVQIELIKWVKSTRQHSFQHNPMQHPVLWSLPPLPKCILKNANFTVRQMQLKSKKPDNTTWKLYSGFNAQRICFYSSAYEVCIWTVIIRHHVRDLPSELACTHNQSNLQLWKYIWQ